MSHFPVEEDVEEPDPNEITFDQFLELFAEMDSSKLEYYAGRMRINGRPFYDFVKEYLAMRDEVPRPR